jgi:hypothetical protein
MVAIVRTFISVTPPPLLLLLLLLLPPLLFPSLILSELALSFLLKAQKE